MTFINIDKTCEPELTNDPKGKVGGLWGVPKADIM